MAVKILKEELKDDCIRWRARGSPPARTRRTGRRTQRTVTGETKTQVESRSWRDRPQVDKGAYIKPWNGTVSEVLDSYLRAATRGKEAAHGPGLPARPAHPPATPRPAPGDEHHPAMNRGPGRLRAHPGPPPGRQSQAPALGVATVRMMLIQLSAAVEMAVDDGKLPRNPARKVKVTGGPKAPRQNLVGGRLSRFFITAVSVSGWLPAGCSACWA